MKPSPLRSPKRSIQSSAARTCGQSASIVGAVARALPVQAGERDEQRRRVDRAVVAAEGHLAEVRELAFAHLVQDLAGLARRRRRPRSSPGARQGSAARRARSTGRATASRSAVISPSRPKAVENQGTPAYGYGPCGVSVVSIARSALERDSTLLNTLFEDSSAATPARPAASARRARRSALKKRCSGARAACAPCSQWMVTASERRSRAPSAISNSAPEALSADRRTSRSRCAWRGRCRRPSRR